MNIEQATRLYREATTERSRCNISALSIEAGASYRTVHSAWEAAFRAANANPLNTAPVWQQFMTVAKPQVAFLSTLAALSQDQLVVVGDMFDGMNRPLTPAQRDLVEGSEPLKAWQAAREERARQIDAQALERAAQVRQERAAQAPERLIAEIRLAGVTLGVDRQGKITAHPGVRVTAEQVNLLAQHKPRVVALLHAEADADRPMVLA